MTEEKTETPKEVKQAPVFKVTDVVTETAPAIETPEGEFVTEQQAMVMLLNEVREIKKLIG